MPIFGAAPLGCREEKTLWFFADIRAAERVRIRGNDLWIENAYVVPLARFEFRNIGSSSAATIHLRLDHGKRGLCRNGPTLVTAIALDDVPRQAHITLRIAKNNLGARLLFVAGIDGEISGTAVRHLRNRRDPLSRLRGRAHSGRRHEDDGAHGGNQNSC